MKMFLTVALFAAMSASTAQQTYAQAAPTPVVGYKIDSNGNKTNYSLSDVAPEISPSLHFNCSIEDWKTKVIEQVNIQVDYLGCFHGNHFTVENWSYIMQFLHLYNQPDWVYTLGLNINKADNTFVFVSVMTNGKRGRAPYSGEQFFGFDPNEMDPSLTQDYPEVNCFSAMCLNPTDFDAPQKSNQNQSGDNTSFANTTNSTSPQNGTNTNGGGSSASSSSSTTVYVNDGGGQQGGDTYIFEESPMMTSMCSTCGYGGYSGGSLFSASVGFGVSAGFGVNGGFGAGCCASSAPMYAPPVVSGPTYYIDNSQTIYDYSYHDYSTTTYQHNNNGNTINSGNDYSHHSNVVDIGHNITGSFNDSHNVTGSYNDSHNQTGGGHTNNGGHHTPPPYEGWGQPTQGSNGGPAGAENGPGTNGNGPGVNNPDPVHNGDGWNIPGTIGGKVRNPNQPQPSQPTASTVGAAKNAQTPGRANGWYNKINQSGTSQNANQSFGRNNSSAPSTQTSSMSRNNNSTVGRTNGWYNNINQRNETQRPQQGSQQAQYIPKGGREYADNSVGRPSTPMPTSGDNYSPRQSHESRVTSKNPDTRQYSQPKPTRTFNALPQGGARGGSSMRGTPSAPAGGRPSGGGRRR